MDKRALLKAKEAIREEVMSKVPFLLKQDGYSPSVDHLVPRDVIFEKIGQCRYLSFKVVRVAQVPISCNSAILMAKVPNQIELFLYTLEKNQGNHQREDHGDWGYQEPNLRPHEASHPSYQRCPDGYPSSKQSMEYTRSQSAFADIRVIRNKC